ncbi:IS6 family transposase [Pelagibius litoralis]|uniref:IS6 family transposase n=1 Tax=Pelagibius litoralis TaxID=374515 RepID=A0A967EYS7_9PROT|nr:IS6 family transposase [Pelagibius litoralis]NIA69889.1 IS6 family transposase [Pelagibius litoralis]
MSKVSYARHHFPPSVIRYAVWLYLRFNLSLRDVEDLLAERGLDICYETVRRWVVKFGTAYARNLRRRRPTANERWHLDEMFVSIGGHRMYLWRTVDAEGEVLDILLQPRRDKRAAKKLIRKLLRKQGISPTAVVTDKLRSYGAALGGLGLKERHKTGGRLNNRAESSHQPVRRRERSWIGFKRPGSTQRFLSTHAVVYNWFNLQRHPISRRTLKTFRDVAFTEWRIATQTA